MKPFHIGIWMKCAHARNLPVLFDHLDDTLRAAHGLQLLEFLQHDSDIHPLIADEVRRVAQHPITQCFSFFFRHGSFLCGSIQENHFQWEKGCIDDFQADTSSSRTSWRRRKRCSSIFSSASKSKSYHSPGISF